MKKIALQASVITLGSFFIVGTGGPQYGGSVDDDAGTGTLGTPATPDVKAVSAYKGALLTWDETSNTSTYELCYATEEIVTYSGCESYNGGNTYSVGSSNAVALDSLTAGQVYYFRVVGINSSGTEGSASTNAIVTPSLGLNDTGITVCRENASIDVSCPASLFPNQDADHGLDSSATDNTDGHAGFSFTLLDEDGAEVDSSTDNWACAKDNNTGLTWEVKVRSNGTEVVGNDGLHDADDSFSWYSADSDSNAGTSGDNNSASETCYGYDASDSSTYCNTEAFVARVNAEKYCGLSNWRLATRGELNSVVNYDEVEPSVDLAIFPYTPSAIFWSGTSVYSATTSGDQAWSINFNYGGSAKTDKTESHRVRLVSNGQ